VDVAEANDTWPALDADDAPAIVRANQWRRPNGHHP
jgi:hypothetical protein